MSTFNNPRKYHKLAEPSKYCDTCFPHAEKLWQKYLRIRAAVRVLNRVLKERKYQEQGKRYSELIKVANELTWTAGQLLQDTNTYTWFRLTREEFKEYQAWRRAKTGSILG